MRAIAKLTPGFVGVCLTAIDLLGLLYYLLALLQADLQAVAKEAATLAIRRILSEVFPPAAGSIGEMHERRAVSDALRTSGTLGADMLGKLAINMDDFAAAVKKVQPSAKRFASL
jgi:SpoVK/Ycf46/Vps4 family AAA+-type ATPase